MGFWSSLLVVAFAGHVCGLGAENTFQHHRAHLSPHSFPLGATVMSHILKTAKLESDEPEQLVELSHMRHQVVQLMNTAAEQRFEEDDEEAGYNTIDLLDNSAARTNPIVFHILEIVMLKPTDTTNRFEVTLVPPESAFIISMEHNDVEKGKPITVFTSIELKLSTTSGPLRFSIEFNPTTKDFKAELFNCQIRLFRYDQHGYEFPVLFSAFSIQDFTATFTRGAAARSEVLVTTFKRFALTFTQKEGDKKPLILAAPNNREGRVIVMRITRDKVTVDSPELIKGRFMIQKAFIWRWKPFQLDRFELTRRTDNPNEATVDVGHLGVLGIQDTEKTYNSVRAASDDGSDFNAPVYPIRPGPHDSSRLEDTIESILPSYLSVLLFLTNIIELPVPTLETLGNLVASWQATVPTGRPKLVLTFENFDLSLLPTIVPNPEHRKGDVPRAPKSFLSSFSCMSRDAVEVCERVVVTEFLRTIEPYKYAFQTSMPKIIQMVKSSLVKLTVPVVREVTNIVTSTTITSNPRESLAMIPFVYDMNLNNIKISFDKDETVKFVMAGEQASVETLEGCGHNFAACGYRGKQDHTARGLECQKWNCWEDDSCVHKTELIEKIEKNPSFYRDQFDLGEHNYCRNPGPPIDSMADDFGSIWCYTTNPDILEQACEPLAKSVVTPTSSTVTLQPVKGTITYSFATGQFVGTMKAPKVSSLTSTTSTATSLLDIVDNAPVFVRFFIDSEKQMIAISSVQDSNRPVVMKLGYESDSGIRNSHQRQEFGFNGLTALTQLDLTPVMRTKTNLVIPSTFSWTSKIPTEKPTETYTIQSKIRDSWTPNSLLSVITYESGEVTSMVVEEREPRRILTSKGELIRFSGFFSRVTYDPDDQTLDVRANLPNHFVWGEPIQYIGTTLSPTVDLTYDQLKKVVSGTINLPYDITAFDVQVVMKPGMAVKINSLNDLATLTAQADLPLSFKIGTEVPKAVLFKQAVSALTVYSFETREAQISVDQTNVKLEYTSGTADAIKVEFQKLDATLTYNVDDASFQVRFGLPGLIAKTGNKYQLNTVMDWGSCRVGMTQTDFKASLQLPTTYTSEKTTSYKWSPPPGLVVQTDNKFVPRSSMLTIPHSLDMTAPGGTRKVRLLDSKFKLQEWTLSGAEGYRARTSSKSTLYVWHKFVGTDGKIGEQIYELSPSRDNWFEISYRSEFIVAVIYLPVSVNRHDFSETTVRAIRTDRPWELHKDAVLARSSAEVMFRHVVETATFPSEKNVVLFVSYSTETAITRILFGDAGAHYPPNGVNHIAPLSFRFDMNFGTQVLNIGVKDLKLEVVYADNTYSMLLFPGTKVEYDIGGFMSYLTATKLELTVGRDPLQISITGYGEAVLTFGATRVEAAGTAAVRLPPALTLSSGNIERCAQRTVTVLSQGWIASTILGGIGWALGESLTSGEFISRIVCEKMHYATTLLFSPPE